jgi:hypothetical protein
VSPSFFDSNGCVVFWENTEIEKNNKSKICFIILVVLEIKINSKWSTNIILYLLLLKTGPTKTAIIKIKQKELRLIKKFVGILLKKNVM